MKVPIQKKKKTIIYCFLRFSRGNRNRNKLYHCRNSIEMLFVNTYKQPQPRWYGSINRKLPKKNALDSYDALYKYTYSPRISVIFFFIFYLFIYYYSSFLNNVTVIYASRKKKRRNQFFHERGRLIQLIKTRLMTFFPFYNSK